MLNEMPRLPIKIRRTNRTFHTSYKEHIQAIRSNNGNSCYPNHILNAGHTYGTTTDIIKMEKKHLNTLEKCYIKLGNTDYT
jgi:hypothetical protein